MEQDEKYPSREPKACGNHLIKIKPPMLEITSSNFPSPRQSKEPITPTLCVKPKLNRWKSAKDVDLSHMATGAHKIAFLTTNYDPNLDVDKEENDIKNLDFDFTRSLLTKSNLENVLIESPPIIHISTHGFHQYKAVNKQTAFQIALEEPQTLRYLIDDHPRFSAIFAVIAILFEQEIHHFVQYGFKHRNKIMGHAQKRKIFKTWIWRDENKFALLCSIKIYKMLQCILDRYGCSFKDNKIQNCVEIFWGKYKFNSTNDLEFVSPPHPPHILYTFSDIYKNDSQVQEILKNINNDYNKSVRQNIKIVKELKKYQRFSWNILSILMYQRLTYENIELDEIDDTKWNNKNKSTNTLPLEDIQSAEPLHESICDVSDDYDPDEWGFSDDDDELQLTEKKFRINQELTREILIDVSNQKEKLEAKTDAIKMQKLIRKLSRLKKKLIIRLYSASDIRILWHFASTSSSNVHIIRFADEYALTEAKKLIDDIRYEPEYSHEYDIKFNAISKSLKGTKTQVGYVASTQEKIFSIDIENKTDPISQMLAEHLRSKRECRIKLLILNGCHSFILGKIFSEYVENVICVHPFVKILDRTATTFTKCFYQSLIHYTNPRIPFSHSVLKAYYASKTNVAKQCSNDFACASHSHNQFGGGSHTKYVQQMERRVNQFNELHFNENWRWLQNHINNEQLFHTYRNKMKSMGVIMEEPIEDLYDNKTLIILNISENEMYKLINYLEQYRPNEDEKEDFVIKKQYKINEYFEELSVAYFKFKSKQFRDKAKEILSQKQYDEELVFSDKILLKSHLGPLHYLNDDGKDDEKKDESDSEFGSDFGSECESDGTGGNNLGWIYRTVPRCCCSPCYPHIVQDKLILLQNGKIINRSIIGNISQIKNGLDKMKKRQMKSMQCMESRRRIIPSQTDIIRTYSCKDDEKINMNEYKEEKKQEMDKNNNVNNMSLKPKKKVHFNNFGTDKKKKKTNNFGNNFGGNNFGGNNFGNNKRKSSNFPELKPKKKINLLISSNNILLGIEQNDCKKNNKLNENNSNINKLNEFNDNNNKSVKFKQHVNQNEYFDNTKFKSKSNHRKKNNFGDNTFNTSNNKKVTFKSDNIKKNNFDDVNRGSNINYEFTEQISNISESSTISNTNTSICSNILPLTSDISNSNEQLSLLLEYDSDNNKT